jgi:hypothetical protein
MVYSVFFGHPSLEELMTRLRIAHVAGSSSTDRFDVATGVRGLAAAGRNDCITSFLALLVSFSLLSTPLRAAPSSWLGTIVYADRARLATGEAHVGTTVYSGDKLSTDQSGSVQVRTGAARFLLSGASSAAFSQEDATPAATLAFGTATFSTANSRAFALHVASAVIRPSSDRPTVGKVTVLNTKELVVQSSRGSLSIAVEDDVREIPEGTAYRVVLDPNAADPQGPRGAGSKGYGAPPIKAAKSKFVWYAVGLTALATSWAVHEAYESPARP